MKRIIVLLLSVLLWTAVSSAAQVPAAVTDLDLETTAYGATILPLGTSVNNNIVVFYEHYDFATQQVNIYSRIITPTAAMSGRKLIATDIQWSSYHHWSAVWSPLANRFMVVYRRNNGIHARPVNSSGHPIGGSKKITNYAEDPLHITWCYGKKFVVFITRGGEVAAQVLRRTGKRYKKERKLTSVGTGTAFPVDAATEKNGIPLAYVAYFDSGVMKLTPGVIKVNKNLKVINKFTVAPPQKVSAIYWLKYIEGAYDPAKRIHTLSWKVSYYSHTVYCTFDENGSMVKNITKTPENVRPLDVLYNPASQSFAIFYYKLSYSGSTDHSEFYFTMYYPNGTIFNPGKLLKKTDAENDAYGAGYARNGNMLVGWVNDPGPGVHACVHH